MTLTHLRRSVQEQEEGQIDHRRRVSRHCHVEKSNIDRFVGGFIVFEEYIITTIIPVAEHRGGVIWSTQVSQQLDCIVQPLLEPLYNCVLFFVVFNSIGLNALLIGSTNTLGSGFFCMRST